MTTSVTPRLSIVDRSPEIALVPRLVKHMYRKAGQMYRKAGIEFSA